MENSPEVHALFLDTNIWLRLFTEDNPQQFIEVRQLFIYIESGKWRVYTSSIVLLEMHFLLTKHYKKSLPEAAVILEQVLQLQGLILLERTNFLQALTLQQIHRVRLADCLIATQLPEGVVLVTYDKEFRRLPNLRVRAPAEML